MTDKLAPGDPRWSLTMERERRGLISRSQMRKRLTKDQQKDAVEIRFPWGAGTARGYKP